MRRPLEAIAPKAATQRASRAILGSRPVHSAIVPMVEDAPAAPPMKKYMGISGVHCGSFSRWIP